MAVSIALDRVLAFPANRATVPALVDCVRSVPGVVPYVGSGLTAGLGIPVWSDFLTELARELEIASDLTGDDTFDDTLLAQIHRSVGDLGLDDRLEVEFGDHRFSVPLPGAISLVPYLTRNLVITTNLNRALELTFDHAGAPFARARWRTSEFGPQILLQTDRCLLKLHGDVYDRHERYLDRASFDARLQPGEPVRVILDGIAQSRPLLFLGVNYRSSKMLEIVAEAARASTAPQAHYAMVREADWTGDLTRLLYSRRIRPVWYPSDPNALPAFLAYLVEQMQPPPLGLPPGWMLAPSDAVPEPARPGVSAPPEIPPIEIPQDLVDACRKGEGVAFIGSGLSARAGLPTWKQFVEGLVDEAVRVGLMSPQSAELQRAALHEGEVNAVADNAVSAFSSRRDAILDYYRRASTSSPAFPRSFELLRQIPLAAVLTSNYDDLLDRTYDPTSFLRGLTPRDSEKLLELLSARKPPFLLKLYGDLNQPDTVVLAPTDYQNLVRSNAAFGRFMEGLFFSRTLLFLGTSLEGLADYLGAFTFPSGVPRQHYALVAVTGRRWQAKAELLQRRYNIKVIPFPVTRDFPELDLFLEELARRAPPPEAGTVVPNAAVSGPQLQKISLRNIGPYKELDLQFGENWKILLGDNGVGKSSILKAIAVAIVGSEARHSAGRLLRVGQSLGSVTLVTAKNPSGYVAEIQKVGSGAEVVSHAGRALEAENWVALGFPPMRTSSWKPLKGPQGMATRRPSAEDMLPLVNGDTDVRMDDLKQWLVNTDALTRKEDAIAVDRTRAAGILRKFFDIVKELTDEPTIDLHEVTTDYRVMIATRDGVVPIEALSQGMTSLLSWIGILLQRLYEVHYDDSNITDPTNEYALVLMDEIDAHMHPSWQQSLVTKLKKLFPKIQVIASTHSPLVVAGMPVSQIVRFVRNEVGEAVVAPIDEDMTLGRADQILTGDLFGLDSTLALGDETEKMASEYEQLLAMSQRTPEQENRYIQLHRIIESRIPSADAETKLERRTQQLVNAILTADYTPEKTCELKDRLMGLTREVAKSMGWKELL